MADRPAKPFDTTLRQLVRADPRAWLALTGWPSAGLVELLDSNVSALQAEVDAALLVRGPAPWVGHLEFQTSYDPDLPRRLDHYNHLLAHHGLPVVSTVVLLRPAADGPALVGRLAQRDPNGSVYRRFRYRVVRLWRRPLDELLAGPLALLPLALLVPMFGPGRDEDERLRRTSDVVREVGARIRREAPAGREQMLWAETFFVLGLRYPPEIAGGLLQGVEGMRDSLTYQAVLEDGRAEGRAEGEARGRLEEARQLLRRLGERRFGPPDPRIAAALERLADLEQIERAIISGFEAASWDDLLPDQQNQ